jgi:hypothetical protein
VGRWALFTALDIGADGDPYLDRLRIIDTPWAGLYLHHIHRPDRDADPHDHPWWFWRVVVSGSYTELLWPDKADPAGRILRTRRLWRPSLFRRKAAHLITEVNGPLWTVVLVGRDHDEWGFWRQGLFELRDRYVPWRRYLGQERDAAGWRTEGQSTKLSGSLTVDGRVVRIPSVPAPASPATDGKITLAIPYPDGEAKGFLSAATVTNEDLDLTFRQEILPRMWIAPGDTVQVEFGEASIDWLEIASRW